MRFPSFQFGSVDVSMEGSVIVARSKEQELKTSCLLQGPNVKLESSFSNDELFMRSLEFLFGSNPELKTIQLKGEETLHREEFFQAPNLWLRPEWEKTSLEKWNRSATPKAHPMRRNRKDGLFYQRYSPVNNKVITFRGIDPDLDLDTFHDWHNQPRVNFFWELAGPKEALREYIIKTIADPHMVPTFVEFDGSPVGYFEMYWTMEDRLGPYYEADAFDRGLHFLIGEKDALGFTNTDSIVKSALHYLFLDDPRTRRVMAEPRHDNKKVLRYAESSGWVKLKEFDFPHKRAALLECKRENFFNGDRL